jgi:hypothetical protein
VAVLARDFVVRALLLKRDVTSLWSTHEPFREFSTVAKCETPSGRG